MSHIEALRNIIHREVQRVLDRRSRRTPCIVDSYDGATHRVKVKLQPEETLSGWMQIETAQTGLLIAPNIGDPGWIEFHENDRRAGVFVASVHNSNKPPPKVISAGEFYYQNGHGQSIYVKDDGSITVTDGAGATCGLKSGVATVIDKANSTFTLNGDGTAALKSNLTVEGTLTVTETFNVENQGASATPAIVNGNINLNGTLAATGDVTAGSISVQAHVHPGVQAGSSDTGPPTG